MSNSFKSFNKHLTLLSLYKHKHSFSSSSSYYGFVASSSSLNLFPHHPRLRFSLFRPYSSSPPATFMEVFKAIANKEHAARGNVAIRADQKIYSYMQLISAARKISNLLCGSDVKVGNLGGARIGIVAKPSAEFVAGILGTWFSGGVAVPLALSYPEVELLHVINNSDVSAILSTEDHSELMQSIANKTSSQFFHLPPVPNKSHSQNGEIDADRSFLENIERSSEDPALILYTSGTTGKPKGVVHTHRSIISQVQTLTKAWEYTSADQFLHCLPLHHVHGLFNGLLAPLYAGSAVEFLPKFSVRGIWQRWRESYPTEGSKADDAITVFTGVPTMYTRLIQGYHAMDPELQAVSASAARNLRLMMCGSSALPQPVMQEWEAITGHRLLERYGMTEFVMALSNPLNGERKAGTVGKPFPGVQVKILADEEGESEKTGSGELCIKSPSLFKEYYKLPQVTKDSFTDDGFFKTGDAVTTDKDGYYIILGRTNADIIKVGGYKLSALEIESVIIEHPAVSECCVLGLPDKDYGEIVGAIIVPEVDAKRKRDEESKPVLSLEELSTWAKDKIAPYKIPTRLILWDSLPRNAMGKVKRRAMEDSSSVAVVLKWIKELADGTIGHELEALATRGIKAVKAHKGFLLCDFIIHDGLLDEDGNWHVGAIAMLVDIIGSFTSFTFTSYLHQVTLDFTMSYYSTAKAQEEVEVEAKIIGKKDELTSVIVEVRKKESGELVAMGKLWTAMPKRNPRSQASKL